MTIPRVAAPDQHAVCPLQQHLEHVGGIEGAGAHHADDADIGGILDPRGPGQIGPGVGAPVAEKGDDLWLEGGIFHLLDLFHLNNLFQHVIDLGLCEPYLQGGSIGAGGGTGSAALTEHLNNLCRF